MIDVIIPVKNAAPVLSLALTHLWAYADFRWITSVTVLDNASTEPEMDFVLAMAAQRERHRVIRHERDVGVWASVNRGLALSRARFALVLTADVLIGPGLIETLLQVQQYTQQAYLAPHWTVGLAQYNAIFAMRPGQVTVEANYNGACWLLDWNPRVRERVGFYDPRFYVCCGDTDYIERLRLVAESAQDDTFTPRVIREVYVCHLDKQARRRESVERAAHVEWTDQTRFQEKWMALNPAVAARHPRTAQAQTVDILRRDLGGWDAARVG